MDGFRCPRCGERMVVRAVVIPPAVEQSCYTAGARRPGPRGGPRATRRRRPGGLSAPQVAPVSSQPRAASVRVGLADGRISDAGGPAGGANGPAKGVDGARVAWGSSYANNIMGHTMNQYAAQSTLLSTQVRRQNWFLIGSD